MNNIEFLQGAAQNVESVIAGMAEVLKTKFHDQDVKVLGFAFVPEMKLLSPLDREPTYMVTMVIALEHPTAMTAPVQAGIVKSLNDPT